MLFKINRKMPGRCPYYPSQHLLVQSQQRMQNLFKVNNKDTRTTSITFLLRFQKEVLALFWHLIQCFSFQGYEKKIFFFGGGEDSQKTFFLIASFRMICVTPSLSLIWNIDTDENYFLKVPAFNFGMV